MRSGDRLTNLSGLLAGYVYPEDTDKDKDRRKELGGTLKTNIGNALAQELYYERGILPQKRQYESEHLLPSRAQVREEAQAEEDQYKENLGQRRQLPQLPQRRPPPARAAPQLPPARAAPARAAPLPPPNRPAPRFTNL